MSGKKNSKLRFNFGFMLEADLGTSREVELDYPTVHVGDDVTLTPLRGKFQAIRNSKGIYITGQLHSFINAECARCLTEFSLPITMQLDDLFYFPPHTAPVGEPTMGEDGFIDLSPVVRQLGLLEIPMQPICRPDCQGFCIECGQNLNESDCGCESDEIDPRLAELRTLLDAKSPAVDD